MIDLVVTFSTTYSKWQQQKKIDNLYIWTSLDGLRVVSLRSELLNSVHEWQELRLIGMLTQEHLLFRKTRKAIHQSIHMFTRAESDNICLSFNWRKFIF